MDSPAHRKSHLRPGQVQEAMGLAPNVHNELSMIELTIRNLQDENSMLKEKMLQNRRAQLEKYFMTTSNLMVQACFHEWDRVYKQLKAQRELDGMNSRALMDRQAFEERAMELQRRIQELAERLGQSRQDGDQKRYHLGQLEGSINAQELSNQQLA